MFATEELLLQLTNMNFFYNLDSGKSSVSEVHLPPVRQGSYANFVNNNDVNVERELEKRDLEKQQIAEQRVNNGTAKSDNLPENSEESKNKEVTVHRDGSKEDKNDIHRHKAGILLVEIFWLRN